MRLHFSQRTNLIRKKMPLGIVRLAQNSNFNGFEKAVAILWGFWWFGMNTIDAMRLCFHLPSNLPN